MPLLLCAGAALVVFHGKNTEPAARPVASAASPAPDAAGAPIANAWQMRCGKNEGGAGLACEAFQRLSVAKTGERVVEFAVARPIDKKYPVQAAIILPLGLRTRNLQFQIDQRPPARFDISYCTIAGCFAFFAFDKDSVASLENGEALNITAQSFQGKNVVIKLSLSGFSTIWKENKPT